MSFDNIDTNNALSVVEVISVLVHQHLICQDHITCRSSSENNINARSCFGGLFASLLRGVDSRSAPGDASRDLLMCSLLKLINQLIQKRYTSSGVIRTSRHGFVDTNAESHGNISDTVSDTTGLSNVLSMSAPTPHILSDEEKSQQTDEQKTENLNEPGVTFFADIILGHRQIMCKFIEALSYCNSNTMATILGSKGVTNHLQDTFNGSDPVSVGDGVYQILSTLSINCSDHKLVLESLFFYLSGSYMGMPGAPLCRLSEPLLWFLLKVLETATSIHSFLEMGGVEVVCRNLVQCNCRIINTAPSLISTIMQNLNGQSKVAEKRSGSATDGGYGASEGLQDFAQLGRTRIYFLQIYF